MQTKEFRPLATQIRSVSEQDRSITFTASTAKVDRYGDSISVAGWELENFKKNSVFLWSHRSQDLPIGKVTRIWTEPKALVAQVQFAPKAVYPFASTVYELYKGKFLSAVSVGFLPLESRPLIDEKTGERLGEEFLRQELLEISAVPTPANADCLARAVKKGILTESQLRSFQNPAPHVTDAELFERFCRDLDSEERDAQSIKTLDELLAALRG